ncbi:MAG TPA: ABC transporter permease [Marinilabiliales bacterium]|nr:MAG: ABC transporter permease [Bacteroidetes bacterium GWA2_40_14]OFX62410.1 MAG: ABC transporter permease [Bacteroidetes bacterium GWC2_40_13]OFX73280.1 MAG: ABC transporter permease [Bacteroidetes bacterium GWD2_40_43]OFX92143.1 MAG: ABC transporter permease [Bacteroidetes bacterium GWE2_40_63]OFY16741.1 MAG: ABC transporter permease [Bacteroidetes bacterium GWF2_40_13]OFZ30645.1 MAG: ABC transporter permease [Bacteroidetes bacterium RIFOXYC2_FULL_40_12]HAM98900.1 ABC transporter permeas
MNVFFHVGRYVAFLVKVFSRPEKHTIWIRQFFKEVQKLGLSSTGIIILVSLFIGAAITIQMAYNITSPLVPDYVISLTTRDTMLLEFSSTIISLVLAGKVGSNVASEIGSMRVNEQIDALEIMGINSSSFLVLPKILAFVFFIPFLVIISMFVGIGGGWLSTVFMNVITPQDYIEGIQLAFIPYYVTYSIIKSLVFAFLIVTISAYQGYYVSGGALEVGKASTKAVVYSIVMVLLFDLILTKLLLS